MDLLAHHTFHVASYGVAGSYAAWLLQGLGAEVAHESALDATGIGMLLAEAAARTDAPSFDAAPGATIITDVPVTDAAKLRLAEQSGSVRIIWLTPWGLDNEFEAAPSTDLCLQAAGGWMYAAGAVDREPLAAPGQVVHFIGGLFATVEALAPLLAEPAPTAGLSVISLAECALATTIFDHMRFQSHGIVRERAAHRFSPVQPTFTTLACKDGHIGIHAHLHRQWVQLCDLIAHPELISDPRFADLEARSANVDELDTYLLEWLASQTRVNAYHVLQGVGVPASLHPTMAEVLASPQLAARDAWTSVRNPDDVDITVPRVPFRESAMSQGERERTPGRAPWAEQGLRVLDISMGWADPMVGYILSFYGADVIKVESPDRFDWWRGSGPPSGDPSLRMHEQSHAFNGVNRGKRGVTMDLAMEEGRAQFLELARDADLVVENFGIDVIKKLGIQFEQLSEVNPNLVMLRLPAFGGGGPESHYKAFGNTMEGMSGLSAMMGYADGPLTMMSNMFGDPVSGLNGLVVALGALLARKDDACGRRVELSQLEGMLPLVSEALIQTQLTGKQPERRGNRRQGSEPSGVLQCAGDDDWVAFEVRSDDEWMRLCERIPFQLPNMSDLTSEAHCEDRYDEIILGLSEWSCALPRETVLDTLRQAAIPSAPVNSSADQLVAEPFASQGIYEGVDREVVGFLLYTGLPVLQEGKRPTPGRPAPLLGEHSDEILSALDR